MSITTLTNDLYTHGFKVGSTWDFRFTRKYKETGLAIDLTGGIFRVMFRKSNVNGDVVLTIENDDITNGGAAGTIDFSVSATQSPLFIPAVWHYFDIEMVSSKTWQSPTMRFKPVQEVTR